MNSAEKNISEEYQTDLVVVGGGGAGLSAGVTAAERGFRVIVVEVRNKLGGNSSMAHGFFNTRGPGQEGRELTDVNNDYFKKAMNFANWRTNPKLVRALVEKSGDIVPFLEKQGVKFEWDSDDSMYVIKSKVFSRGALVTKALARRCEELNIRVLLKTRAKKLLTEEGKVTGVLAETEGKQIRINAGSVIIATGGFAGNRQLLKKYIPSISEEDEIYYMGIPHQGDGLIMATEISAATDDSITVEMAGKIFPWDGHVSLTAKNPKTIWVNKNGERFVDESLGLPWFTNATFRQPRKIYYSLFDEKIKQAIMKEELNHFDVSTIPAGTWPSQVNEKLRAQVGKGRVKISDSWDEIARWMNVDKGILKTTIDEYNAICDQGNDTVFAKGQEHLLPLNTPPYYTCRCWVNLLVTHGGIKVNHHMEVLNKQGYVIPGLYAVGNDTGDVDADTYNRFDLPGHSFGFAMNSGRIAGENVTK